MNADSQAGFGAGRSNRFIDNHFVAQGIHIVGLIAVSAVTGISGITGSVAGGSGHNALAKAVAQLGNGFRVGGVAVLALVGDLAFSLFASFLGHRAVIPRMAVCCHVIRYILIAAVAGIGRVAKLGASGCSNLGAVAVTGCCHDVIKIAVAANGAGIGGVACISAGGFGNHGFVAVFHSLHDVSGMAVTADRAGVDGVANIGAGGFGNYGFVAVLHSLHNISSVAVAADGAGVGGVTNTGAGGISDHRFIAVAHSRYGVSSVAMTAAGAGVGSVAHAGAGRCGDNTRVIGVLCGSQLVLVADAAAGALMQGVAQFVAGTGDHGDLVAVTVDELPCQDGITVEQSGAIGIFDIGCAQQVQHLGSLQFFLSLEGGDLIDGAVTDQGCAGVGQGAAVNNRAAVGAGDSALGSSAGADRASAVTVGDGAGVAADDTTRISAAVVGDLYGAHVVAIGDGSLADCGDAARGAGQNTGDLNRCRVDTFGDACVRAVCIADDTASIVAIELAVGNRTVVDAAGDLRTGSIRGDGTDDTADVGLSIAGCGDGSLVDAVFDGCRALDGVDDAANAAALDSAGNGQILDGAGGDGVEQSSLDSQGLTVAVEGAGVVIDSGQADAGHINVLQHDGVDIRHAGVNLCREPLHIGSGLQLVVAVDSFLVLQDGVGAPILGGGHAVQGVGDGQSCAIVVNGDGVGGGQDSAVRSGHGIDDLVQRDCLVSTAGHLEAVLSGVAQIQSITHEVVAHLGSRTAVAVAGNRGIGSDRQGLLHIVDLIALGSPGNLQGLAVVIHGEGIAGGIQQFAVQIDLVLLQFGGGIVVVQGVELEGADGELLIFNVLVLELTLVAGGNRDGICRAQLPAQNGETAVDGVGAVVADEFAQVAGVQFRQERGILHLSFRLDRAIDTTSTGGAAVCLRGVQIVAVGCLTVAANDHTQISQTASAVKGTNVVAVEQSRIGAAVSAGNTAGVGTVEIGILEDDVAGVVAVLDHAAVHTDDTGCVNLLHTPADDAAGVVALVDGRIRACIHAHNTGDILVCHDGAGVAALADGNSVAAGVDQADDAADTAVLCGTGAGDIALIHALIDGGGAAGHADHTANRAFGPVAAGLVAAGGGAAVGEDDGLVGAFLDSTVVQVCHDAAHNHGAGDAAGDSQVLDGAAVHDTEQALNGGGVGFGAVLGAGVNAGDRVALAIESTGKDITGGVGVGGSGAGTDGGPDRRVLQQVILGGGHGNVVNTVVGDVLDRIVHAVLAQGNVGAQLNGLAGEVVLLDALGSAVDNGGKAGQLFGSVDDEYGCGGIIPCGVDGGAVPIGAGVLELRSDGHVALGHDEGVHTLSLGGSQFGVGLAVGGVLQGVILQLVVLLRLNGHGDLIGLSRNRGIGGDFAEVDGLIHADIAHGQIPLPVQYSIAVIQRLGAVVHNEGAAQQCREGSVLQLRLGLGSAADLVAAVDAGCVVDLHGVQIVAVVNAAAHGGVCFV